MAEEQAIGQERVPQGPDPAMLQAVMSAMTGGGTPAPPITPDSGSMFDNAQKAARIALVMHALNGGGDATSAAPAGAPAPASPAPSATTGTDPLTQMFSSSIQKGEEALQNSRGLAASIGNVPPPSVGYNPAPVQGFLPNLWRGLKMLGAATTPGQIILAQAHAPDNAARAAKIAAIQEALAPEKEAEQFYGKTAEAAGNLAYRQGMLGVRQDSNDIRRTDAETRAKAQAANAANLLVRQSQGWKNLDIRQQGNNIRAAYNSAMEGLVQQRIAAGMDENQARIQSQQDMRAALAGNQYATQHPILSLLGIEPEITSTPAAAAPKDINAPPAKQGAGGGKASASKGTIYARDPQGVLHQAPAGTALPKGWMLEVPRGK